MPRQPAGRLRRWARDSGLSSRLGRGAVLAFAVQVGGVAASYVLHVVLARWLGVAGYGTYTLALAWATTLAIAATLGLDAAALRFVAEYHSTGRWALLRGLLATSWGLVLLASSAVAALGTALISWWWRPATAGDLILGLWLLPVLALLSLQGEMARGLERVGLSQVPQRLLRPLLLLAAVAVAVAVDPPLTSRTALLLTLACLGLVVVGQLAALWRALPAEVLSTPAERRTTTWLRVALPLVLATGFVVLLNQLDLLMVGFFRDAADVGLYNAAVKTATLVTFVIYAINVAAAPRFAALHAGGDRAGLQRLASSIVHWAFWPSLLLTAVLAILAGPLLAVFGPAFPVVRWELRILAFGHLFSAGVGSVGYLLNQTGHERDNARVLTVALVLGIVLNLALIPPLGTLGAALATTTTWMALMLGLHHLVVRRLGVHPSIVGALRRRRSS